MLQLVKERRDSVELLGRRHGDGRQCFCVKEHLRFLIGGEFWRHFNVELSEITILKSEVKCERSPTYYLPHLPPKTERTKTQSKATMGPVSEKRPFDIPYQYSLLSQAQCIRSK